MMKIDFVSDVACPWCAVGLYSLEKALSRLQGEIDVDLRFQPFELNPNMPPEGAETVEYLARKYGASREQLARNRQVLRDRGAEVGFTFGERPRVWNTFDAHRLLFWAGREGKQRALKHALIEAYHGKDESPASHEVLLRLAGAAGLDTTRAREILASDEFAADVRRQEQFYQQLGIDSVPSVIVNERHLIQGGQPAEIFEQALRQIAAESQVERQRA